MYGFPWKSNHSLKPLGKNNLENWVEFFTALAFAGRKKTLHFILVWGGKEVTLEFPAFWCYLVSPNTSISSVSAAWYPCVQCTGYTHTRACTDTLHTPTHISHLHLRAFHTYTRFHGQEHWSGQALWVRSWALRHFWLKGTRRLWLRGRWPSVGQPLTSRSCT